MMLRGDQVVRERLQRISWGKNIMLTNKFRASLGPHLADRLAWYLEMAEHRVIVI